MNTNTVTPLKAIREKCLDCCCQQKGEVRQCTATNCPLHIFRFGKNPNRKGIGSVINTKTPTE